MRHRTTARKTSGFMKRLQSQIGRGLVRKGAKMNQPELWRNTGRGKKGVKNQQVKTKGSSLWGATQKMKTLKHLRSLDHSMYTPLSYGLEVFLTHDTTWDLAEPLPKIQPPISARPKLKFVSDRGSDGKNGVYALIYGAGARVVNVDDQNHLLVSIMDCGIKGASMWGASPPIYSYRKTRTESLG